MAKKKPSSTSLSASSLTPTPTVLSASPSFSPLDGTPLPTVHINPANLTELEHAIDDAVKATMQTHQFTQSHVHTDVRLLLGYASVVIMLASSGWAYKVGFEESKIVVAGSIVGYALLQALQMGYSYYIEGNIIYQGKRKSLSKRIETETLHLTTLTLPSTRTINPPTVLPPRYQLTLTYRRSTNANKSLLRSSVLTASVPYGELVDEKGGVEEGRVAEWVGGLVRRSGVEGGAE